MLEKEQKTVARMQLYPIRSGRESPRRRFYVILDGALDLRLSHHPRPRHEHGVHAPLRGGHGPLPDDFLEGLPARVLQLKRDPAAVLVYDASEFLRPRQVSVVPDRVGPGAEPSDGIDVHGARDDKAYSGARQSPVPLQEGIGDEALLIGHALLGRGLHDAVAQLDPAYPEGLEQQRHDSLRSFPAVLRYRKTAPARVRPTGPGRVRRPPAPVETPRRRT